MRKKDALFIYFHGFNSAFSKDSSDKLQALETLGNVCGPTYDSFADYETTYELLMDFIDDAVFKGGVGMKYRHIILVGTSLGGYWASKLSEESQFSAILINPSHEPQSTMKKHVGVEYTNYKTGDKKTLDASIPQTYEPVKVNDLPEALVLLDEGGEVLDISKIKKFYEKFDPVVFPGGNHRFAHIKESLPLIKEFIDFKTLELHFE